ncbi:hypothetical protein [Azospirillum argentinense]
MFQARFRFNEVAADIQKGVVRSFPQASDFIDKFATRFQFDLGRYKEIAASVPVALCRHQAIVAKR